MIKALAAVLRKGARESDMICRYGGEEFLVAMPMMAPALALSRVETWRSELAETIVRYGDFVIRTTLSAGIAGFPEHGADGDRLLAHADEALYRSKKEGRNRVSCYASGAV